MFKGELFQRWPEWDLEASRREAADLRLRMYKGNYKAEVAALVRKRVEDPQSAAQIVQHVTTAHGLLGAVADTCAVCYQRGVRRELRGTAPDAARAFADIVGETRLPAIGAAVNATAWAVGPVIALPYVAPDVRGTPRLRLYLATADRYSVRRAANGTSPDELAAVLFRREDGTFVEVDAEGWRYWSAAGRPLDDGAHDAPHGLGYCPAAVIRARPEMPYDWSGSDDHHGLTSAALEVGVMHAIGRWTRTQTSVPLTVIFSTPDKYAKLQALGHPSQPLVFDAAPQEARVDVLNRVVDPRFYLQEIQALAAAAIARYGIPPSAVNFTNDASNWGTLSVNVTAGTLALQRDSQTPLLHAGEVALWLTACDVVRSSPHRHAEAIPPREQVERALRVAFPELSTPDEQIKRTQALKERLPLGLSSPADDLMTARPELTRFEAEEEVAANLHTYVEIIRPLVERNVPADPHDRAEALAQARPGETVAQAQGRAGGEQKAANAQADNAP